MINTTALLNYLKLCLTCIVLISDASFAISATNELQVSISTFPRSLNPLTGGDAYGALVEFFTLESLISQRSEDNEVIPRLAESWTISNDKKTYTFVINKNARFFDGKPVSSADFKYTMDQIYDPACVLCQNSRDFIGPLEFVKAIDPQTVSIRVKTTHFNNLRKLGSISVLPKHLYEVKGKVFWKDFEKVIYGSGPYTYQPTKDRRQLILTRNHNWWGNTDPKMAYFKASFHFQKINIKVIKDDNVAFEMFKKKKIDLLYMSSDLYNKWDNIHAFPWKDKNCARLDETKNYPSTWRGVALNFRRLPTSDKKFRKALQHLLNRPMIIEKVFKNKRRPVAGPFLAGSPYSANIPPAQYDPKVAVQYLKSIGYTQVGADGILYKTITANGKPQKIRASIEIMHAWEGHNKWLTIYKEDAKKVGVEIRIKLVEWTTAMQLMDDFKFDGFVIGWLGSIIPAPEGQFAGETANKKGTSNYPGLNNQELNQLMKEGPTQFDDNKRYALYQKMEKIIVDEQPYIFTYTDKSHLVGYWAHRLDPSSKPFLKYTGNDLVNPFYARWRSKQGK